MKVLRDITPTAEQLTVIRNDPSLCIIRGCIGCGKTSTAILRLQFLVSKWARRRKTQSSKEPIRVLILTFNRTLRGYIEKLVEGKVRTEGNVEFTLSTIAKWSCDVTSPKGSVVEAGELKNFLSLAAKEKFSHSLDFLADELDYVNGRFKPKDVAEYLECERMGRGSSPKCDKSFRQTFLDEIVTPYHEWKTKKKKFDWNDCVLGVAAKPPFQKYDIIICDEVQDFSANEMRAVLACTHADTSITFVLDAAQRIYPRSFHWKEVGLKPTAANFHRLKRNFRNTREIAAFVAPIVKSVDIGGDEGTLPNPKDCERSGPKPRLLEGTYSKQLKWVVEKLLPKIDLENESVAFLKPLGGGWFKDMRTALAAAKVEFVELTRSKDWPKSEVNVALCTMHSAKGLEFDHVIILGLNQQVTPHGMEAQDTSFEVLARLFGMACGRAKESLTVGYKKEEASSLIAFLDTSTFDKTVL